VLIKTGLYLNGFKRKDDYVYSNIYSNIYSKL
jgi:hypothetical protein